MKLKIKDLKNVQNSTQIIIFKKTYLEGFRKEICPYNIDN